jgi:PAS domain S-box-containing protein
LASAVTVRDEVSGLHFLANGGECGARMRAVDWSRTPLGPPQHWPQSLKTIVRVMLDSRYAMWMGWGTQLTFFCNDAYLPTVGVKRDWVMGARADAVWQEIWPDIGPRIAQVLSRGEATWDEGLLLFLERSGFPEETYHTFSYSPVYDDASAVTGLLCVVTEVTDRVIGERRLHALRDVAARAMGAQSVEDACQRAVDVMTQYPLDLPFAGLYLLDAQRHSARLVAASQQLSAEQVPRQFLLGAESSVPAVTQLLRTEQRQRIDDMAAASLSIPASTWPEAVQQAWVLPIKIAGQETLAGFALLGVSPRRLLDDAYLDFLDLIASQIGSAVTDAQAYEAARSRAEALAQLDRAKTAFFSNISHEFRTPLTLIMSPLEQAMRSQATAWAPGLRDELAIAHRNGLRLQRLVTSLLDFSRMEAGRIRGNFEPVDLAAVSAQLAGTFRTAIERAGLALEIRCPTLAAPVYLDRELWEQIVLNLVSNAFKYTLSGSIRVCVQSTDTHAQLSVSDTGSGIPAESLPHLFERFYRVPNAKARTFEGTGIGLALVHELVELHGGKIEVQSEPGVGSTFIISLAFGASHLPAQLVHSTPARERNAALADSFVEEALTWSSHSGAPAPVAVAGATPQPKEGLILLVDDNGDMRSYVGALLSEHWNVITAADGLEALEQLKGARADLVLTDVMMPRLDGFGLLAAIRSDASTRDLPVIMLSARAGEEARLEGLHARANDYLVKPFTARELIARVRAQIGMSKLQQEAKQAIREAESANRAAVEALNRQLALESEELRNLFEQAPNFTLVLKGQDLTVALANKSCLHLIGDRAIIGKPLFDAVPEMAAEPYEGLLRDVLRTGETYSGRAMPLSLQRRPGATPEVVFVDLVCQSIRDLKGSITGILLQGNDVTEHKHMEETLRESDRRKDEFLAMLAHELRNPLAPILNATELLTRTAHGSAQTKPIAELIHRQTAQMARLVEDLLDVSRITQGRIELRREPLEVGAIVNQALEAVDPLLRERRHQVLVTKSYRSLYVNGDLTRLVQCVSNLLTNAAKYTDAGGQVQLQVREQRGEVLIEVRDSGVGISSVLLPRVFDLFVQSDRSLDRSQGGLGIGLAVVKRLVEMHGGGVNASSEGVGRGARFEIRLPMISEPIAQAASVPQRSIPARRILVVDDNVDAALSLSQLLELDGHTTHAVYGALEALEQISLFKPDIVLLDIGLPQMNGYEVARRLRERNDVPPLKLVALTGYGQSEDRRRALAAGFDAHLAKPVDLSALERVIAQS